MSKQLLDTPAKHPFSLTGLADRAWNNVAETAIRTGWGPVARVAEAAVVSLMQRICIGQLRVRTHSHIYTFPGQDAGSPCEGCDVGESEHPDLRAELRVLSDTFWVRLCLMGDLGFAEAYMYGEVECDDLVALFKVFLKNRERLSNLTSTLSYLFTIPQKLTSYRFLNTIGNSRSNISAHYDISNDMFAGFLSEDMTYSCAIFPDLDGDLKKKGNARQDRKGLKRVRPAIHQQEEAGFSKAKSSLGVPFPPSPPLSELSDYDEQASSLKIDDVFRHVRVSETRVDHKLGSKHDDHGSDGRSVDLNAAAQTLEADDRDELESAQFRKLDHIIQKLKIPTNKPVRVLEIGSGWGSMAIRIAQRYPLARIATLTLSVQQKRLAEERIRLADAGVGAAAAQRGGDVPLSERIEVHLMDYRAMPPAWKGAFDRVVSVEMVEAVGREYLETYWRMIDWAMKPKEGVGVVQAITIPEAHTFGKSTSYGNGYALFTSLPMGLLVFKRPGTLSLTQIFPGGFLPTVTLLLQTLQSGSQGKLIVDSISNIGPHYARTLREWRQRFLEQFDAVIMPALRKEYPNVMGEACGNQEQARKEIEVFKRKWIYYYCYCEVGFTTRTLGDHIITFLREGYEDFGCDIYE